MRTYTHKLVLPINWTCIDGKDRWENVTRWECSLEDAQQFADDNMMQYYVIEEV